MTGPNPARDRQDMLDRIEREIERCEKLMWEGSASPPQMRDLRQRLASARAQLERLRSEPSRKIVEGISSELAHWAGNRDPLPEPNRLTASPFGTRDRRD